MTDSSDFLSADRRSLLLGAKLKGLVARHVGTPVESDAVTYPSGAALVGPAPTAAIAISKGWKELVTPGIMCGIFGYVIATFIGVSVTALLS